MNRYIRSIFGLIVFSSAFIICACSSNESPMKTFPEIKIPDGELLRYGVYLSGVKQTDIYLTTKKETNVNGDILYRTYINIIQAGSGGKPSRNYKNWPAFSLFDPKSGSVVESGGNLNNNDMKNWLCDSGFIFWNYKLHQDEGFVEYISKNLENGKTNTAAGRININRNIPNDDIWFDMFNLSRVLDIEKGGYKGLLNQEYFDIPVTFKFTNVSSETLLTKAGKFQTKRYEALDDLGFKWLLMMPRMLPLFPSFGPYFKKNKFENYAIYVENSDRRLIVKEHIMVAGDFILEEIGNITNLKL